MSYTPGTFTGTLSAFSGTRRNGGKVLFIPSVDTVRDTAGKVVMRGTETAAIVNGVFTISLPPTDDATLDPTGFTYTIVPPAEWGPPVSGVALPGGSTRDYADLVSTNPADPTYQPGDVTRGELTGVSGRVTTLETLTGSGRLSDATLSTTFVGLWKANTAYSAGQAVVAPGGTLVTAKAAFTSGATYLASNWNSTVANPLPVLSLAPIDFRAITGTIPISAVNSYQYLSFPAAAGTITGARVPDAARDWVQFDVEILWFNVGAGTGAVDWRIDIGSLGDTETIANPASGVTQRITATGQNVIQRTVVRTGVPVAAAGKDMVMRIVRAGNTDTLANAAGILSVRLVKTDP